MSAVAPWQDRADAAQWDSVRDDVDAHGCALTGPLLTPGEAAGIAALYPDGSRFRATIDMGRYRFGEGEYRYFAEPFPEAVTALKEALYPKLLPIARDWWARLGREAPWPDRLEDWLEMCHAAGQTKPTPILLRYGPGGWNALHRDLYGELVFPLQVVINLSAPGTDHTGGEFLLYEQRPRAQSRNRHPDPAGPRAGVHHPRPPGEVPERLVGGTRPARRVGDPFRPAFQPRPRLPRRGLSSRWPGRPRAAAGRVVAERGIYGPARVAW